MSNPFGGGLSFLKKDNNGVRPSNDDDDNSTNSSKILFRPSKLSGIANDMWEQRKSEAEKEKKTDEDNNKAKTDNISKETSTTVSTNPTVTTSTVVGTFVFGTKIKDRVTDECTNVDEKAPLSGFQDLAQKAQDKKDSDETEVEGTSRDVKSDENQLENGRKAHPIVNEVEVKTGEEDENNLFHATCKMYVFHADESAWHERGQGILRINEKECEGLEQKEIRLVMRVHGSLRVILNAKLWLEMVLQRATPKRIRFSALDPDTNIICVYLLAFSQSDADTAFDILDGRLKQLKDNENSRKRKKTTPEPEVSPPKSAKEG